MIRGGRGPVHLRDTALNMESVIRELEERGRKLLVIPCAGGNSQYVRRFTVRIYTMLVGVAARPSFSRGRGDH